jgi:hypothetical protein
MKHVLRAVVLFVVLLGVPDPAAGQAARPYNLQQIVSLLQGGWAGTDILGLVREDCISFRVTGQNETALRRAGADAGLLTGLRQVCFRGGTAEPTTRNTPPPARGIVLIEGELPPGWSRRVNDLPVSTNRRIDLTPGRTASIVVSAPGWCPARTEITLRAGEEERWTPELRARPWIGGCL